jgi:5-(carboxyamino)imidazole ribonucleotide synthase
MLKPGNTIGILGGGQLARMMALAAAPLGLKCHIYAPKGDNPAFDVSAAFTEADYEDEAALMRFASSVSVVTYEFENVPARTAEILSKHVPVLPSPSALEKTQDRLTEKNFIRSLGLETAPYADVQSLDDLKSAVAKIGVPSVLKTRRFGYDGKGQIMLKSADALDAAWAHVSGAPSILEGFVPFRLEVSVVAASAADGQVLAYDVTENAHAHHILSRSTVPASVSERTAGMAKEAARKIGEAIGYIGVFGVEFFVVGEGADERVIVNEIAPRVHNSGHWTLGGAVTSQFEQHIRAISGWPLGSVTRHGRVVMDNLIGDQIDQWQALAAESGALLELYGKAETRPGRKMGHVTRVYPEKG